MRICEYTCAFVYNIHVACLFFISCHVRLSQWLLHAAVCDNIWIEEKAWMRQMKWLLSTSEVFSPKDGPHGYNATLV